MVWVTSALDTHMANLVSCCLAPDYPCRMEPLSNRNSGWSNFNALTIPNLYLELIFRYFWFIMIIITTDICPRKDHI